MGRYHQYLSSILFVSYVALRFSICSGFTSSSSQDSIGRNLKQNSAARPQQARTVFSSFNPRQSNKSSLSLQTSNANERKIQKKQQEQQQQQQQQQKEIETDLCEIGINTVDSCSSIAATESQLSVSVNLAKCICGAGSFALPHVFLEEGVFGGTVAIATCGLLATITMQSLAESRLRASGMTGIPITSYVQLAREAIGKNAATVVFALTLCASLGVCSTYLVFIGQTLESMSSDAGTTNIVRMIAPDVSEQNWEIAAALILYPLSLIRDYSIFAFTSALGVFAVIGGIIVTLAYGIFVDPGGGLSVSLNSIETLPLWPSSFGAAFGGSFGTICYLFAINFLTFPIMNSIKEPREYDGAVEKAVASVWAVNVAFAIIALGFYREETQDLVLANLSNGPYLSALKLLLCIDLLFTFPIVFSSGRQILENSLIGADEFEPKDTATLQRAGIVAGAVVFCYALAQVGGFGAVANLVGGVAQGTLAFVMPPAIALSLAQKSGEDMEGIEKAMQYALVAFGTSCVAAVTYFTASEVML